MAVERASPRWIAPVPNLLTALRLALALAFPFAPEPWRLPMVVGAGASDFLDGWIARRFHAITHLGRLMDGIADKAFVLSAVVTLGVTGHMPWWEGAVVMTRDVVVGAIAGWCLLCRAWAAFRHMRPRLSGKVTTAAAFLWFLALLIHGAVPERSPMLVLAAGASVWAGVDYALQFVRLRPDRAGRSRTPAPAPAPPS